VVDDNEANRLLAQATLEDEGYRVLQATSGAAAIAMFATEEPDCILLDVRMPEMDGLTTCKHIRALPGGRDTPILFLTALRDVDTFDQALRAGADDFLTKPVRPTELVLRVQAALRMRRMSAELREHFAILRKQRDDLLRLQLQKERLMAFVVHDLKNPVNSMDLHAQLLMRTKGMPEAARESVASIRAEARQLSRMILNLLDLSKGDEGKLSARRVEVDLTALIRDVFSELGLSAEMHGVRLESSIEVTTIHIDADLFRRTLTNLVENAIRHSPPSSVVSVAARAVEPGVEVSVKDAGRGVAPELRESIFDPFVQLQGDTHSPGIGGRGLGLTFCRLAVEAHGGRIWVEDVSPGAVFRLTIPE
jgi:signal transduction histidine kinase